jgi:parallel beta-helix repeat protein
VLNRLAASLAASTLISLGGVPALTQVACGDTITTSVVLASDLDCTGAGLIVGADKVTIDLNGFTLRGDGDPGDLGIDDGGGFDRLTIRSGRIEAFEEGVSIGGDAQQASVEDVEVFGCLGDGIDLNDSDGARITGTLLTANGAAGLQIGANATGNRFEKSAAVGNVGPGVEIHGSGNSVLKSELTLNGDGVVVLGGGNTVSGTSAYRNEDDGIEVRGDANEVVRNAAFGNLGEGIEVTDAADAVLERNTASGNGENGIWIDGASAGARLARNATLGNDLQGIQIDPEPTATLLERNTSSGNLLAGFQVYAAGTTLKKNTATANGGRGIAATGAIDGGGNRASFNPDANCEGVVCQ